MFTITKYNATQSTDFTHIRTGLITELMLPNDARHIRSLKTVLATTGGGSSSRGLSASSSLRQKHGNYKCVPSQLRPFRDGPLIRGRAGKYLVRKK